MTEFHKLVRDRILEIIKAEGRRPVVAVLAGDDFRRALLAKLVEEAAEAATADGEALLDELADVYEVVRALAEDSAGTMLEVAERADVKARVRGRFERQLLLIRVEDEEQGPTTVPDVPD